MSLSGNRRRLLWLSLCCAWLPSCRFGVEDIAAVPASPSYAQDVFPIYQDHCLLCHSSPSNHDAPTYFRLDLYDDSVRDGQPVQGAAGMAGLSVRRILRKEMPPAAEWGDGLGPHAAKTVENWSQNLRR